MSDDVKEFFFFCYLTVMGWYGQLLDWWDGLDPFQKAPWILLLCALAIIVALRSELRDKKWKLLRDRLRKYDELLGTSLRCLQDSHYVLSNKISELLYRRSGDKGSVGNQSDGLYYHPDYRHVPRHEEVDENDDVDGCDHYSETTKVELTLPDNLLDSVHGALDGLKSAYDQNIKALTDQQSHVVGVMSATFQQSISAVTTAHETAGNNFHAALAQILEHQGETQKITCDLIHATTHPDQ